MYSGPNSEVRTSILSEGCEVLGKVYDSVLGPDVIIEEGAVVKGSILMGSSVIGKGAFLERCIVDTSCTVGENVVIGAGENIPNINKPHIYDTGISVLGESTFVPGGVKIGKNCVIYGNTAAEDYINGELPGGHDIIKGMEVEL
jgi:glucose-1-phosphate adenylyltransferase